MIDPRRYRKYRIPGLILCAVLLVAVAQLFLLRHQQGQTNQVAITSMPIGVTGVRAAAAVYQPTRRYVGNVEPWLEAKLGPQVVSAYVQEVTVRPGDSVKRGDILARLDCRSARAKSESSSAQAKAMRNRLRALADQAERIGQMANQGYMAGNEAEMKLAESTAEQARLEAAQADLRNTEVAAHDCIMTAPFNGDVFTREADPGSFISPGKVALSLVDRSRVRVVLNVPESDFELVEPGASVEMTLLSTGKRLEAPITRRAPAVDPATRTVQVEIEIDNPGGAIPVHTTASVRVGVGKPTAATEVPLTAASIRGTKATLYTVVDGRAHLEKVETLGEREGRLFVETRLKPGSLVVTEGRGLLDDGAAVRALESPPSSRPGARAEREAPKDPDHD